MSTKSTITLTQGANVVNFDGHIIYPLNFSDKKNNQVSKLNIFGAPITYSTGNTICNALMIVKDVTYADGELLRTWLKTKIRFMYNTFTISAISEVDFGKGENTAITNARFPKLNLKDVLNYEEPGIYTIKLPYRFIRT